jgi:hypothetical protein
MAGATALLMPSRMVISGHSAKAGEMTTPRTSTAPSLTCLDLEILLHACSFLTSRDLGRLACVSRSFGAQSTECAGEGEQRSLVEEASRRWVLAHPLRKGTARRWAGQGCWLRHMHAICAPLVFSRKSGGVRLSGPGCQCRLRLASTCQCPASVASPHHCCEATKYAGYGYLTAASGATMRRGRHCAEFTVGMQATAHLSFGVIRPEWDVENEGRDRPGVKAGKEAHEVDGHCFFHTDGTLWPGAREWEGMQRCQRGDRIALLLDFDAGTMTAYKNQERLGVMAAGLSGEYSWAVSLHNAGDSARIVHASVNSGKELLPSPPPPEPGSSELLAPGLLPREKRLRSAGLAHGQTGGSLSCCCGGYATP